MAGTHRSPDKVAQPQDSQMLLRATGIASPCVTRYVLAFVLLLCVPGRGYSQQTYAFGVGVDSCEAFLSEVVAAPGKTVGRTGPDDGRDYYAKSTTYLEWLLGFVTGYNAARDPQSQFQFDAADVDHYVRSWCAQNPTSNIFTAVRQFLNKTDP